MTKQASRQELNLVAHQSTNPSFLIEMSHALRHIIMKRSYFLRSTRARTLFCLEQIAGKSWLEVSLVEKPKNDVLPWDQAHNLAERVKAELKADVFVEPAHLDSRDHKLTAIDTESPFAITERNDPSGHAFNFDPKAGVFCGSVRMSGPGFGSQFGMTGMGTTGMPVMASVSGMNSNDFLPAHVKEALSLGEKGSEMVLPALRALPAFIELPEATRNMYEVEALQVLRVTMEQLEAPEHEHAVAALLQLPNVSKHLRRFLAQALPVAA